MEVFLLTQQLAEVKNNIETEGQCDPVTYLEHSRMVLNPEVWDMNIARQIAGENLLQQEAFAEASAAHLQPAQAAGEQREHCPSHHRRNRDYLGAH